MYKRESDTHAKMLTMELVTWPQPHHVTLTTPFSSGLAPSKPVPQAKNQRYPTAPATMLAPVEGPSSPQNKVPFPHPWQ